MKPKQSGILACLVVAAMLFQYCSKSDTVTTTPATATTTTTNTETTTTFLLPQLPASPFNYSNIVFPAHIANALPSQDNTPATNPITNDGATLGRVLFYDKNLSKNNTVSCGSCHRQDLSFSDSAVKSIGFLGGTTARHSMQLLNVRFYRSGKMFWDERAATLEDQVLQPIQNTTEMGMTLAELETKVSGLSYYPALFQKAFGTTLVTSDRISKSLAQFVRSIVTYQSKYDQVKQGLSTFTADERDGETLFLTAGNIACAGCHAPPMFLTSSPAGPFALNDPTDLGINNQRRFKSGSLRNIANTAPYFHNGSVASLQGMLAGNIPAHSVAPQDRQKLLAFLQTLTDVASLNDAKFSNPFK
ncbi:MAG: cytochrome c peroxidase [Bacteroidota bacterium]